jgi:acetyltransferase-like isoleucine patch superfamily enzyme
VLLDKVLVSRPGPSCHDENYAHNTGSSFMDVVKRTIVGIGAIVLDGVEVGRYSIVGSGCVVPPG